MRFTWSWLFENVLSQLCASEMKPQGLIVGPSKSSKKSAEAEVTSPRETKTVAIFDISV
jgi:hypothetical protein